MSCFPVPQISNKAVKTEASVKLGNPGQTVQISNSQSSVWEKKSRRKVQLLNLEAKEPRKFTPEAKHRQAYGANALGKHGSR